MAHSVPTDTPSSGGRGKFSVRMMLQDWVLALAAVAVSAGLLVGATVRSDGEDKGGARAVSAAVASPLTMQPLPEFVADLSSARGGRVRYVSITAFVEIPEEAVDRLQQRQTPILAEMQARLRERRREELVGAAGMGLVRDELENIVNQEIAPYQVQTVLFSRFLLD